MYHSLKVEIQIFKKGEEFMTKIISTVLLLLSFKSYSDSQVKACGYFSYGMSLVPGLNKMVYTLHSNNIRFEIDSAEDWQVSALDELRSKSRQSGGVMGGCVEGRFNWLSRGRAHPDPISGFRLGDLTDFDSFEAVHFSYERKY